MTNKPEMLLWLNDARGVYIPRDFANSFADRVKDVSGVSAEQWAILESGPDHELYWDVWAEVGDSCIVTDDKQNVKYRINHYGDCWLVPIGMEWNDELGGFAWPEEENEEA